MRYDTKQYKETLLEVFALDISQDKPDAHPQFMCLLCERSLARSVKGGCGPVVVWKPHHRTACTLCSDAHAKSKGGHPPKRKALSQSRDQASKHHDAQLNTTATHSTVTSNTPNMSGMDISAEELLEKATPAYKATTPLDRNRFVDNISVSSCMLCGKKS